MDCACCHRGIGPAFLAYDAARKIPVADVDFIGLFCLPRRVGTLPFEVKLFYGRRVFAVISSFHAGVAQW